MKGCKNCKFNRMRTLEQKTCLKEHFALYGFNCIDYEPIDYEIGYQLTIFDILEEERRKQNEQSR